LELLQEILYATSASVEPSYGTLYSCLWGFLAKAEVPDQLRNKIRSMLDRYHIDTFEMSCQDIWAMLPHITSICEGLGIAEHSLTRIWYSREQQDDKFRLEVITAMVDMLYTTFSLLTPSSIPNDEDRENLYIVISDSLQVLLGLMPRPEPVTERDMYGALFNRLREIDNGVTRRARDKITQFICSQMSQTDASIQDIQAITAHMSTIPKDDNAEALGLISLSLLKLTTRKPRSQLDFDQIRDGVRTAWTTLADLFRLLPRQYKLDGDSRNFSWDTFNEFLQTSVLLEQMSTGFFTDAILEALEEVEFVCPDHNAQSDSMHLAITHLRPSTARH